MPARQSYLRYGFYWVAIAILICPASGTGQSLSKYDRAMASFAAKDYRTAAVEFAQIENASPGATDALLYEAKCLIQLQEFPAADAALRGYIGNHAESQDALYLLGFVLHRENRPKESLEIYTRAAARQKPSGEDLKIVGLNYVLLNDYADAIKWLEKAVAFEPQNSDVWYYLGRAYYSQTRVPDAKNAFLTVLKLEPFHSKAENNLGLIFESEAKPDEALGAYRNAINWQQRSPKPSEQPYLNLGSLLLEQGNASDALPPLEKAVQIAPNDASCHLKLGSARLRLGKLKEAQPELEEAARLEPENAAAHFQLGRLYKQLKLTDRAKKEFDRAGEIQSREARPQSGPKQR
jgi:tetratricopeptide (TPR) repeat protein